MAVGLELAQVVAMEQGAGFQGSIVAAVLAASEHVAHGGHSPGPRSLVF
jgi:hypothetical protein